MSACSPLIYQARYWLPRTLCFGPPLHQRTELGYVVTGESISVFRADMSVVVVVGVGKWYCIMRGSILNTTMNRNTGAVSDMQQAD